MNIHLIFLKYFKQIFNILKQVDNILFFKWWLKQLNMDSQGILLYALCLCSIIEHIFPVIFIHIIPDQRQWGSLLQSHETPLELLHLQQSLASREIKLYSVWIIDLEVFWCRGSLGRLWIFLISNRTIYRV